MICLNIGCGGVVKPGYINLDIQKISGIDVVGDARILPFKDEVIDRIESFHLIEHFDKFEAYVLLNEWFRVLVDKGRLIIECPDLKGNIKRFLEGDEFSINTFFGLQRNPYDYHKYGYTIESLSELLEKYGFKVNYTGEGTDYHTEDEACIRVESFKNGG